MLKIRTAVQIRRRRKPAGETMTKTNVSVLLKHTYTVTLTAGI